MVYSIIILTHFEGKTAARFYQRARVLANWAEEVISFFKAEGKEIPKVVPQDLIKINEIDKVLTETKAKLIAFYGQAVSDAWIGNDHSNIVHARNACNLLRDKIVYTVASWSLKELGELCTKGEDGALCYFGYIDEFFLPLDSPEALDSFKRPANVGISKLCAGGSVGDAKRAVIEKYMDEISSWKNIKNLMNYIGLDQNLAAFDVKVKPGKNLDEIRI